LRTLFCGPTCFDGSRPTKRKGFGRSGILSNENLSSRGRLVFLTPPFPGCTKCYVKRRRSLKCELEQALSACSAGYWRAQLLR
jgi:hypothetical protein